MTNEELKYTFKSLAEGYANANTDVEREIALNSIILFHQSLQLDLSTRCYDRLNKIHRRNPSDYNRIQMKNQLS